MSNKEKLKDAYEKLRCFNNPLLQDIADTVQDVHHDLYNSTIDGIITEVTTSFGYEADSVKRDSRKQELIYMRYLISKKAYNKGFSETKIAEALGKSKSVVSHYLNNYNPPAKFRRN